MKRYAKVSHPLIVSMLTLILGLMGTAAGENIYIAQTSRGGNTGADSANANAVAWFNAAGNWGVGAGKISPGDTVHLCGTITTKLTFQGNGTSGNPIVLKFENNAKFSAPTWVTGYQEGIIAAPGRSYVEVDGGTNGLIEATNNGSSPTYANQNDICGVFFQNCSHCRVHNLTVSNLFIKNTTDSQSWVGDGIEFSGSSDSRVDHNTVHDALFGVNWSLNSSPSNIEVDHNVFYHVNFGTVFGAAATVTVDNIRFHDNEVYDWQNWDDLNNNSFHHNGVFAFLQGGSGPTSTMTGLKIYNNYFHGDPGQRMTANINIEVGSGNGTILSPTIFNNVFMMNTNNPSGGHVSLGGSSPILYNNLFGYVVQTGGLCMNVGGTGNVSSKNNIFLNCGMAVYVTSGSLSASDYNDFYGNNYLGPGFDYTTLAQWQAGLGLDPHSTANNSNLDANFKPQAGSPLIGHGTNLTSLGIVALNVDKAGNPRPNTGAWDIGAYQYVVTEVRGPKTEDRKSNQYGNIILPNPIKVVLLKQYLQKNKNLSIYDLTGNPVKNQFLLSEGIYVVQESASQIRQKVAIIK